MSIDKIDSHSYNYVNDIKLPKPGLGQFRKFVEKRAYEISLERVLKGLPGDEKTDWASAEAEIKKKYWIS